MIFYLKPFICKVEWREGGRSRGGEEEKRGGEEEKRRGDEIWRSVGELVLAMRIPEIPAEGRVSG